LLGLLKSDHLLVEGFDGFLGFSEAGLELTPVKYKLVNIGLLKFINIFK
jgi:hypothetical protein